MKQARQLLMLAICCLGSFALAAQTFAGSGAGSAIPPTGTGGAPFTPTVITFNVTASGVIGQSRTLQSLNIDLNHTWVSDLYIDLTSPDGKTLQIMRGEGGSTDNLRNIVFTDGAANSIEGAVGPFANTSFRAESGYLNAAFGGSNINGTWRMRIYDTAGGDSGTMLSSSLVFTPFNSAVFVPTEEVNLAGIRTINLTLNDECGGLVIPEMVLTGDFDADDNGFSVPSSAFDVVVMDSDPSNGPIVDECGTFQYRVTVNNSTFEAPTFGFTEDFAIGGPNVSIEVGEEVQLTTSTEEISIISNVAVDNPVAFTPVDDALVEITFPEDGFVSFMIEGQREEAGAFLDVIIVDFEGTLIFEPSFSDPVNGDPNGATPFSARFTELPVAPGNVLTILLDGDDEQSTPANSDPDSEISITDFVFFPAQLDGYRVGNFVTTWGTVNAEDKTSPAVAQEIEDVNLLCVDIDNNTLTTLPTSVSKCYRVFASNGATVVVNGVSTMAPQLRARLLAGGLTPLVPLFTDACSQELRVCVNDVLTYDAQDPLCEDVVLTRTFTATEIRSASCQPAAGEGNAPTTSSYQIIFRRPTLDNLDGSAIEDVVYYEQCGTANPTRANYPAPRVMTPTFRGDFPVLNIDGRIFGLRSGEAICNIGVTYADGDPIVTCPFTYKFVRTYTVIDWCEPSVVRTFTQVVKVGDTTAPVFTGPTQDRNFDGIADEDLVYSTNAGNVCAAFIRLDAAGVRAVDNCSGTNVTITANIYPGANLNATPIGSFVVNPNNATPEITSAIPVGTHLLRYTYTDQCGNTGFSDYIFTVEDRTAPVAICEDGLNIGISSGSSSTTGLSTGFAVLTPANIDNGSYDDCSGVTLSIARVNAANIALEVYDQELILTCADLGTVRVGLRVEDAAGNVNFCWLDVLVEDKNAPVCIPPSPVTLSCIEYNASLPADITETTIEERNAVFGAAAGVDNCEVEITETITGSVNSCGVGSFTRTFRATDGQGLTNVQVCQQRITVYGIHDYRITFPTDEEGICATVPDYDGIVAEELACDLITITSHIDTLRTIAAGEECFKLRITYDVVNWCEYNTLGQPYLIPRDGDGIRNPETQLLYLNVIPRVTTTLNDDFAFLSRFTDRVYNPTAPQFDRTLDDGNDNDGTDDDNGADNNDTDVYATDDSRGAFRYIQFVKIYDEVAPVIEADEPEECFGGTSVTCTADLTLTFTAVDECSDVAITLQLDANYDVAQGFRPDNAAALGVGITLTNNGDGSYSIRATNVPVGEHAIRIRAADGCGNFDVEILEFCVTPDKAPTPICIQTLTVTLMPNGQGGGMAAIWATDFIASDVFDCFGNLIDKYSIYTEEEAGVAGFAPVAGRLGIDLDCDVVNQDVPVRVYAIADNGSADYCSVIVQVQAFQEGVCGDGGPNLTGAIATRTNRAMENVEVTITGSNDMDQTVLTNAAGQFSFTNLAAGGDYTVQPDYRVGVNVQEVKTSDIVKIAKVILGSEDFDSPYDYLAADADQNRSLNVLDLVAIQRVILGLDANFATGESWGFVPADVNVSNPYASTFPGVYNVNDLAGNILDADFVAFAYGDVVGDGRSTAAINAADAKLEAGQTHTIVISGADLAGFQGTIELAAGLELVAASYEGEGAINLNRAGDGMIAVALRGDAVLSLEVLATEAGTLSNLVSLTDAMTVREGVSLNGAGGALTLNFSGVAAAELVNSLEQNAPNPVAEVTTIGYTLAAAGKVTLSVQDVQGRTVMVRELEGAAGRNVITLNVNELGAASGVLSYTLTAENFSATKKMVVVR